MFNHRAHVEATRETKPQESSEACLQIAELSMAKCAAKEAKAQERIEARLQKAQLSKANRATKQQEKALNKALQHPSWYLFHYVLLQVPGVCFDYPFFLYHIIAV